ncbi:hypothetical protein HN011_011746 [Eciton burchellii]|nr:hypothetical protein HN011_011746 [Eciton burchellii]
MLSVSQLSKSVLLKEGTPHAEEKFLLRIWCLLSFPVCFSEKLSPDQKAPLFARGSGGLILNPPLERGPRIMSPPANLANGDGVERKEIATLKLVDGDLVRVVEGSFSYQSPEGIPVSVHYVADENGNRAGFKLGAAAIRGSKQLNPEPGSNTYLPPKTNVDRSYLPPQ